MKVNKVMYIVLSLFLGGLGIHKFYADKVVQGVVYLLFFWTLIPHVIAIITGIITIFTKKADAEGYIYV